MSLPNILTYGRIAAIPVVVGCVFLQSIMYYPLWLRWVALAVFIAAAITDYLDGYYARIWDQHSAFGRMLDPDGDIRGHAWISRRSSAGKRQSRGRRRWRYRI